MWSRGRRSLSAFQLHNASGPVLQSRKTVRNLSLLLDVVSRFALYSGISSVFHSKRKCISIHVFSCECRIKLGTRARCPGYKRWASSLSDVKQRLSVMERAASDRRPSLKGDTMAAKKVVHI